MVNKTTGIWGTLSKRPRLWISCAVALAVYFASAGQFHEATRSLIAWNVGAWAFIAMILIMMARSPDESIRAHAADEDEDPWILLLIGVVAATAAMAAIVWQLGPVKEMTGWRKVDHLLLVAATILSAWTFIHIMFALHYAAEYYGDTGATDDATRGGLEFPGETNPGWSEFLYQAFVIGTACATADVNATSKSMRRTCLVQGVVAFFFNTIILALTINIGAGLF